MQKTLCTHNTSMQFYHIETLLKDNDETWKHRVDHALFLAQAQYARASSNLMSMAVILII